MVQRNESNPKINEISAYEESSIVVRACATALTKSVDFISNLLPS